MSRREPSTGRVLVVNAGSSSLKLRVVQGDAAVATLDLPAVDPALERAPDAVRAAISSLAPVDAVGHRIVHGGESFTRAVRIDASVMPRIEALAELAPLHQPSAIAARRWAAEILPDVPHVACFDTAFHAGLPAAAATYALPAAWRRQWPLRRFGFHGLSHAYTARRAAELLGRPLEALRMVTAHLGAGASLAAVVGGRSVDTTMGFTPLEGLVMATRSGSVDPGLVLWLQRQGGLAADTVSTGLEREAGLLGLAGTADMRELLAAAEAGDADAVLARDVYLHRLRASVAAMAAAAGGLDALVFTGGVGENAGSIRAATVRGLGFLGLDLDDDANEQADGDRDIAPAGAACRVLVVASREDLQIAREVAAVLA